MATMGDPPPVMQDREDKFNCNFAVDDVFSTTKCYERSSRGNEPFPIKLIWKKSVPTKISFFIWSAMLNAIQMADNVRTRDSLGCWKINHGSGKEKRGQWQ
ncbi:Reverse transcriptase zinc-binding domain [Macleaya cordata]|uniref:Reverse transcriptase zinc-binding domain n=1 Tax=Macleaya cordata TaxID=56857 RepID=A0A200QIX7_MACCD|nr:Reverse transcriptase zinc-binding domain [Macleaya cordata]